MELRILPPEEYDKVRPIFEANGTVPPVGPGSLIAVVEDKDKVVGFFTLQLITHGEPLWVDPEYRGQQVADLLIALINSLGIPYYSFSDSGAIDHLAQKYGLTETPYKKVWLYDPRKAQGNAT